MAKTINMKNIEFLHTILHTKTKGSEEDNKPAFAQQKVVCSENSRVVDSYSKSTFYSKLTSKIIEQVKKKDTSPSSMKNYFSSSCCWTLV